MKDPIQANAQNLVKIEDHRASTGNFNKDLEGTTAQRVHEAQVQFWDTRKALALSLLQKGETPLSFIRSLIQAGDLVEAKRQIGFYLHDAESDPLVLPLIRLEQVRIAFFEADWAAVVTMAQEALSQSTPPVTQLALLQLKANAEFEQRNFYQAYADIKSIESLGRLYPHAISLYYAETLKIKIVARDWGVAEARKKLDNLLEEKLRAGRADLDLFLTYLRVVIDLARLENKDHTAESVACYHLADAIGDPLYAGLALLDIVNSLARSPASLINQLARAAKTHPRVMALFNERRGNAPSSVTGESMRLFTPKNTVTSLKTEAQIISALENYGNYVIVIATRGVVIDLAARQVSMIGSQSQAMKAIKALAAGPVERKEFFRVIWELPHYTPHLHYSVISTLLNRVKKTTGMVIRSGEGKISTEKKILAL